MHHILAVCDTDEAYASKLTNYINLRGGFPFEARYFSSVERMEKAFVQQRIEVILVSEELYREVNMRIEADKLIVLREKPQSGENKEDVVWKYQAAANLMKQVLDILAKEGGVHSHILRKKRLKVIGFYSPIKRVMQTSFIITFGQLLAKKTKVLYLNLEPYSGLERLMEHEFSKDLSDLLYYLQNGKNGFSCYLYSMTEKIGNLELLPPMRCQLDLISITEKEWKELLYEIEVCTEYEYLLIDFSDCIQGLYEILRSCDRIYSIADEDEHTTAKMEQYEKMLKQCGYEDVLETTRKISLTKPIHFPNRPERFLNCELGDEAGKLLKEDFYAK